MDEDTKKDRKRLRRNLFTESLLRCCSGLLARVMLNSPKPVIRVTVSQCCTAGCIQTQFSLVNEHAVGGTCPAARFVREGGFPSAHGITQLIGHATLFPVQFSFYPSCSPIWNCRVDGLFIEHININWDINTNWVL